MSNTLRPEEARSTLRRPPRPMLAQSRSGIMPRDRHACASRSRNRLKSECMERMCGSEAGDARARRALAWVGHPTRAELTRLLGRSRLSGTAQIFLHFARSLFAPADT